jgi:hypothetical protein
VTGDPNTQNREPEGPTLSGIASVLAAYIIFLVILFLGGYYFVFGLEGPSSTAGGSSTVGGTTTAATPGNKQPSVAATLSAQKKDLIQAVAFTIAGAAAAMGIYFTSKTVEITLWHNRRTLEETQETWRQNQRGQSANRFTQAIDQIGSDKIEKRLGGIYALDQITRDDKEYRGRVTEVLCAYIRTNYPRPEEPVPQEPEESGSWAKNFLQNIKNSVTRGIQSVRSLGREPMTELETWMEPHFPQERSDIDAILAIFRRTLKTDADLYRDGEGSVDYLELNRTDLRRANLENVSLEQANLANTYLPHANLRAAVLKGASLRSSELEYAILEQADLLDTNLSKANLQYANLTKIQNWEEIGDMELANIYGVTNPPAGFVASAKQKGAVEVSSIQNWRQMVSGTRRA